MYRFNRITPPILWACLAALVVTGCAHQYRHEDFSDPYGFFSGLWHGYIFIFSFIGSMIYDDVFIIGKPNTGLTYFLGFFLGICAILSSG
jgi:hypothetical protein